MRFGFAARSWTASWRPSKRSCAICARRATRSGARCTWCRSGRPTGEIRAFYCQSVDVGDRRAREAKLERAAADAVWLGRIRRP